MNLLETKYALENKGQEILEKLYTKEGVKNNLKRYEDVLQGLEGGSGKKVLNCSRPPEERRFPEIIQIITTAKYLAEASILTV